MNDTLDFLVLSQLEHLISDYTSGSKKSIIESTNVSLDDSMFLKIYESEVLRISTNNNQSDEENIKKISQENELVTSETEESIKSETELTENFLDQSDHNDSKLSTDLFDEDDENPITDNPSNSKECIKQIGGDLECSDRPSTLLSSWGLPELVTECYTKRNIKSMFDWQVECLTRGGVIDAYRNLVYSAPTSAGKTLVAEILSIKCLFQRKKKVIFILPFISVVREKMYYFQDILESSGKRVEGFMGSYNPPGGFKPVHFAIGTIEKCNSLVNRLLEEGNIKDLGLVVIDEIHLISDPSRGYLLELLLTKLKYINQKNSKSDNIQIIGMSATLPNLNLLAKWLDAESYTTEFRPIPLQEMIYAEKKLYDNKLNFLRKLENMDEITSDTDDVLQLVLETIADSCSVLIFCPTKNWCETLSEQLAMAFWKIGKTESEYGKILREKLSVEKITEVLEQLKYCPSGLDKVLAKTVAFGAAFHHAGLTMEERDIVEGGFRNGAIKVLVATSTLSSGVNLPARRVIIRSPIFNGRPLDVLSYRQMIGRAGRTGIDAEGQSVLICRKNDFEVAKKLLECAIRPAKSCLEDDGKLRRAVLEIIASGVASSKEDVDLFGNCTLLWVERDDFNLISKVVDFLLKFQFIRCQWLEADKERYIATPLGKACVSSSLPPGEGLELLQELDKARQCFVLDTELHIIYLVTPYNACYSWPSIDWMFYLEIWDKLTPSMKRVGELVGVKESFIINATRGRAPDGPSLFIHKRFLIALALQDLVNETALEEVAEKFNCNRGMLQSLQQSASTFAGMVTTFSRQLGWSNVEILVSQFQDRLQFGVNRDLLDLMRLPILNGKQARAFFDNGFETLVQIANSDAFTLENILHKVGPFENLNEKDGETKYHFEERKKLRNVWITGKHGLTINEAAKLILNDARSYLEKEMGVSNIKWGCSDEKTGTISQSNKFINYAQNSTLNSSDITKTFTNDLFHQSLEETTHKISALSVTKKRGYNFSPSPKTLKRPKSSKPSKPIDLSKMSLIDLNKSAELFECFCKEVKNRKYITISVFFREVEEDRYIIGLNLEKVKNACKYQCDNKRIEGIAFTWDGEHVFYTNMGDEVVCLLRELLSDREVVFNIFDVKENIVMLGKLFDFEIYCQMQDPKIIDWILEPNEKAKDLVLMVPKYCPEASGLLSLLLNNNTSKLNASIAAIITWHLLKVTKEYLFEKSEGSIFSTFEAEMYAILSICKMEIAGIGISVPTLESLIEDVKTNIKLIERKTYSKAGRKFSLSSGKEIAKVVGMIGYRKNITRKEVLDQSNHPVSKLIQLWRKLTHLQKTILNPLLTVAHNKDRVHGKCITHTATGRISMQEPNLQNVPKTFEFMEDETKIVINCRAVFVPKKSYVFLSADYCQLELRILAHLSGERKLRKILNTEGDIFKQIAAKWNGIEENLVSDEMRTQAKQICYGIIYGIGSKALASNLKIEADEAAGLMENFKKTYPSIKTYVESIISGCQANGFVETISGRRRYLPLISDENQAIKSHTERQAVNTVIQGSAADLVKKAMMQIEKNFALQLSENIRPKLVLHLHDELMYEVVEDKLSFIAGVLKDSMEDVLDLSVRFPIKLKVGRSWGDLVEYKL